MFTQMFTQIKKAPFVLVLLLMGVVFSLMSPAFLDMGNLTNILKQSSILGFVALGMAFVLITGGLDLSVGSVMAFSAIIIAGFAATLPPIVGVHVALLLGILIGVVNGVFVAIFNFQPIIVTLSSMAIVRGIAMVYSDSRPIFGTLPDDFFWLFDGLIFGIPVPVILLLTVYSIAIIFMKHTELGRQMYQVGGDETSAHLAGVEVTRIKIVSYALSGLMSSIAGLLLVARMRSGEAVVTGVGLELDAIAAAAIGGVSLMGGTGTILGTLCGVLIISMMSNAFNLLGINPYWQRIIVGIVLAIAVISYANISIKKILANTVKRFKIKNTN